MGITTPLKTGKRVLLRDQGDAVYVIWKSELIDGRYFYSLVGVDGMFLRGSLITTARRLTPARERVKTP